MYAVSRMTNTLKNLSVFLLAPLRLIVRRDRWLPKKSAGFSLGKAERALQG